MIALLSLAAAICLIPAGVAVPLATDAELSSKTSVKGDLVPLRTTADVSFDGRVVIPKGTAATGQVAESRGTGGMGIDGRLTLRPLYLRLGERTVRLAGAARTDGGMSAGKVAGMLVTPVVSGKSATIAAGTPLGAVVDKAVGLPCPTTD